MSKELPSPGSVSIYTLMANLFAETAKEVIESFGQEGEAAIRRAVRTFGRKRGAEMAQNVARDGKQANEINYLPYYDMARSELFECENSYEPGSLTQDFSKCIFARAFKESGLEKYGLIYCQEIDPAIASGYNPAFKCRHDKYLLQGDGSCLMTFSLEGEED